MTQTNLIKQGVFFFDPKDKIYNVHFPGNPIVPGSVIIHAFIKAVNLCLNNSWMLEVQNFKFKQFIRPGFFQYKIYLKCPKVMCELFDEKDHIAAQGVLLYAA